MMTLDVEPEQHSTLTMDSEPSEIDAPWSEVFSGGNQESGEFFPTVISNNTPTRHRQYDDLKLLGEINFVARGGSSSAGWLYTSNLERFRSPMENTVLHLAALHGNAGMVDVVVAQYPNLLFTFNKNHDTPLHVAARAGHIPTLRKLLDACANSNVTRLLELTGMKNNQGNIMLHEAIMSGRSMASNTFHVLEECCSTFENRLGVKNMRLLESCYELALNNVNKKGQSVLYLAVEAGLTDAVNWILDKCPESATPAGISPLVAAIMKPDKGMLTIIVRKKREWIHLRDMNGRLPLHCAAFIGYHEGVVYLLKECKTCSNERDEDGSLPLHLAARGGHVKVVKELLRYCPDPNEMVDREFRNILHIAADSGKLDVVRYILQTPTLENMINQKHLFGDTPLHVATSLCRHRIVFALTWDDRVDLNVVNRANQTALDIVTSAVIQTPSSLKAALAFNALTSAGAKPSKTATDNIPKENIEQAEKIGSSAVDSLSVISTLIVTASVAACLSVPGEAQGAANNLHKAMFHVFIFCITISFFSSISATIILLWVRLGAMELLATAFNLAMPLLGTALVTLSLAFLAGVYTVISKLSWLATTFVVLTAIFVAILFVMYTLVYLPISSTKKVWRYISYYPFIFQAWLAEQ